MKTFFVSLEYKKNNKIRANNRFKRGLAFKKHCKHKNRTYNNQSKQQRKLIKEISYQTKGHTKVLAPRKFSFIRHPNEATKFINELEKLYLNNKPTFVDLIDVDFLDHSAIAVLASIARTFKVRKVKLNGFFPRNEKLKKIFIESDFFKYFTNQPIGEIKYRIGKNNQMFTTKNTEVDPKLGLAVMEDASQVIWGKKRTCKGLQRTLLELMQNANNHAELQDKGVKHWWLSVNHNKDENKVSFIFVDYGVGIFKSLGSKSEGKWLEWKKKIHGSVNDRKVLQQLMGGELHKTVTGEPFRGKGLPGIKQVLDRNQISELHIISNKVFADISQNQYNNLPDGFNGTFVYWELNKNNKSLQWIKQ